MLSVVTEDGDALSRSLSETIPTSLPSFITGARRICSSRNIASASLTGVSGVTEMTGRDILSPTNILTSMVTPTTGLQAARVANCEIIYNWIIRDFIQFAVTE